MSRFQPKSRRGRRREAVCALLLATSVLALIRPQTLQAQETELRGSVSESAMAADQQRKAKQLAEEQQAAQARQRAKDISPADTLQPAGADGAPRADAAISTGSIFDPPATADDPFADDAAPLPRYRPSTTKKAETDTDRKTGEPNKEAAAGATKSPDDQEEEDDRANRRAATIDSDERQPLDPGAERTGAIEGLDRKPEEEPFAAVGIRVGSFILKPSIEQGVTATSNADSSSAGKPAVLSQTTLRLNAVSDWERNSATLDGYGIFRKTVSGDEIEDAQGRVEGTLNLDLDHDWRAIARLGYEAAPESASSPVVIEGTASQPLRQTLDGSLGIEKRLGKMRFGLTGAVEHDAYGDARLSAGGVLSQKDRDSTLYTAKLRGGYEISPAITPFAELELGRRLYDRRIDGSGFERSATRLGGRAGLQLDLGEKLAGEFSAGWLREAIDDDRLAAVSGATMAADIKWSPERGTTVGLNGTTTVEGTTTAGESGSILYSSRLSVEREIRADLTGEATLGADWRDYTGSNGHDLTLSAEAGLTWWLNRYVGISTRARTEKLTSNLPGRDATTNSVFVGLKLQR